MKVNTDGPIVARSTWQRAGDLIQDEVGMLKMRFSYYTGCCSLRRLDKSLIECRLLGEDFLLHLGRVLNNFNITFKIGFSDFIMICDDKI